MDYLKQQQLHDEVTLLEAMAMRSTEERQAHLDRYLGNIVVEQGEDGTLRVVR
jgi:hypothetical protein